MSFRENKTRSADAVKRCCSSSTRTDWSSFKTSSQAVQLYDFTVDGTVEIKYNWQVVGVQQIDLVYLDDADGYAGLSLDRTTYPQGSSVHFVMTDLQLNIDPTDEDSWTFATNATAQATTSTERSGTNGTQTFYQVFDENGDSTDCRCIWCFNIWNSKLNSSNHYEQS